ncbi:MAG: DNA alkylation repair protein [Duncaniella sp.]|nr:DNA alkylation repair protein [Duncaniella sp.]
MTTADDILDTLRSMENEEQRLVLTRFFKCGKGQYGEGDRFLGLKVPQTRAVVREARLDVPLDQIERLLYSPWHEARLCGLLLLVEEMKCATPRRRESPTLHAGRRAELAQFYLRHARRANNWDLVDLSCEYVLGVYLLQPCADGSMPSRDILDRLAASDNLWEQRIAIVSTFTLIRAGQFDDTLRIARKLLNHPHDLIHKAVGWMLREVGKRDIAVLRDFLSAHHKVMPRTTLRYAIEKMDAPERARWMAK